MTLSNDGRWNKEHGYLEDNYWLLTWGFAIYTIKFDMIDYYVFFYLNLVFLNR